MSKAQILVVLAMLSVGLQSVSAAPIEGQFVEENDYQWSVQVTHCEPTIDMTKYPVIVGEKAVYLVLLDERDVQKGGGLCDYQPALMPVPKDYVEISGNKLSFKVNLEGQKLPFYCMYLGVDFPDKLVMVTIEELAKHSVRYDWGYISEPKPLTLSFLRKIVEAFESQVDNPFPHSAFKNEAVWNAVRDTPYIISGPVHVSAVDYGTDYVELEIEIPVRTDVTELTGTIEVKSGESTQTLSVTGSDVVNGVIKKREYRRPRIPWK
ncbi:hypothetical protein [Methanopyrus kandleri]|uniref:Uncharacterized secreted protein specific for M.kandleri with repeats, MK-6 family n=2 Tax=Methanopyrus kandleri TaxID=2320 RepID=Q8TXR9_METKA|nr:hypothetical protein [Methanopyrus kandleri]AAM01806.1 Uncharacterized secreted protein specific for M.kandleri with repeats, MK-6 family [Methanopyrus kandleri AV19]HII70188.1 hypothetical protein [Methanopyrus kandleri]